MATGYFAGLLAFVYRETSDGRRVTSRRLAPFLPPRWLLVPPEAQARFERRTKQAHIAFLIALPIALQFIVDDAVVWTLLVAATALGFVAAALIQAWTTAGLPEYDQGTSGLVPVRRLEMQERQARAMGPRMLASFVVLCLVLAIPQAVLAVQDGLWWAWLGFVSFAGMGIFFARVLIRIRSELREAKAP